MPKKGSSGHINCSVVHRIHLASPDYEQPFYSATVAALTSALIRARRLIVRYLGLVARTGGWSLEWDFNQLHDLEDRLEQRLRQVYGACYDWQYNTCGWVAA